MSQEACDAFTKFLGENTIVTIVVAPERCKGLNDFPPGNAVRLDLSHMFTPPMWPNVTPYGLDFHASFNRVSRAVSVPWSALIWAGVPNLASGAAPTQAQVAATATPAVTSQVKEGKLIHVNFRTRQPKPGPGAA